MSRQIQFKTTKRDYSTLKELTVRERAPGESLERYYKALAKQADRRMRNLEQYANEPHFKNILKYAYGQALYDIRSLTGDLEATRFDRVAKKTQEGEPNKQNLKARINAVKKFLQSPSSTKRGLTAVYRQRAESLNAEHGTDFDWQDLANFFESGMMDRLMGEYKASDTIIQAIYSIRNMSKKTLNEFRENKDRMVTVSDDAIVNEIANELLKSGYTADRLFGGNGDE